MKKLIISTLVLLVAFFATTGVYAQEPASYTSEKSRISVVVPDNALVQSDSVDALVIVTPDGMYALSVIPFNMKDMTEDEMAQAFAQLGIAAKLDTDHMEQKDIESSTVSGTYNMSRLGAGLTCVGIAATEKGRGFFVTLTLGEQYLGYLDATLKNFNAQ